MKTTTKLALGLGALTLATPLGLVARGTAWGEWASSELAARLGFVPVGMRHLENAWHARFGGYQLPRHSGGASYAGSAVVGVLTIVGVTLLVGWFLAPPADRVGRRSFFERTLRAVQKLLSDFFLLEETPRRPGLLQRIDPRVKLVTLLASVVLTTLSHSLPALAIFYAATLVLAAASRLSLSRFILRTWLFIPLFTAAMVLPLVFTPAGARLAALLVLRTATAVSWSLLLIFTTRWSKLFSAMEVLRVPRIFIWSLQMMVRYLQMLARQLEELQWAFKSRVLGNFRARQGQRVVAQHMGLLFQKSLAVSEEVYAGLRSRGYMGGGAATSWWRLQSRDYAWLAAWLVGVIVWKARF